MESIINDKKECFVCHKKNFLHLHHIFFGRNRKKADEDGLTVYLCYFHHEGDYGVHGKNGHDLDKQLKEMAEKKWMEINNKTIDDFIDRYKKNYL